MESGQNLWTGLFWAVFFFVFGVSEQLESSMGCRMRLRALMNLGVGGRRMGRRRMEHRRWREMEMVLSKCP